VRHVQPVAVDELGGRVRAIRIEMSATRGSSIDFTYLATDSYVTVSSTSSSLTTGSWS
jgi:hypothetical protein